jgi:ribosomal protein S18 acetylase RimI-like enzyme
MTELCLTEVPWEKRNLGMHAYQLEGIIENYIFVESILEQKKEDLKENFFVQLKLDADMIDEVKFSQDAGFKFAEMSICPYLDLNIVKSKISIDGTKSQYSPELPSNSNVEKHYGSVEHLDSLIKNEIINISQESFSTDRFHMDSCCEKSIADARIGLWLELDILTENKNYCTYLRTNKNLIGFIIWNQGGFILGGLSRNFIGKGFGKTLYIQAILDAMNSGLKEISTNISVNNLPVLNLYSKLGFSFRNPKYLLHYWSQA